MECFTIWMSKLIKIVLLQVSFSKLQVFLRKLSVSKLLLVWRERIRKGRGVPGN